MGKKLDIYSDGGSRGNPGEAAAAFVAKDEQGNILQEQNVYVGKATNNIAEYEAILLAWKWLVKVKGVKKARFFIDSQLAVRQLKNIYRIKDSALERLIIKIRRLEKKVDFPTKYIHVNREKNTEADDLVNEVLDKKAEEKD